MARILIVDDDPSISVMLRQFLKLNGHEGICTESVLHALDLVKQDVFDLVITDLRMPYMNGMEVLREVKKRKSSVPVIMVTAYASAKTAIEAVKLGVFDYIAKPFKVDDLMTCIERALAADKTQTRAMDGYTGNNPAINEYFTLIAANVSRHGSAR